MTKPSHRQRGENTGDGGKQQATQHSAQIGIGVKTLHEWFRTKKFRRLFCGESRGDAKAVGADPLTLTLSHRERGQKVPVVKYARFSPSPCGRGSG
ncbi:hypothetical protein GCM10011445_11220 [Pseudocitrobacter faecalis]|nr:hypothetical protein GCM10011445_11220 [Pseudocitrobacter faecalis]